MVATLRVTIRHLYGTGRTFSMGRESVQRFVQGHGRGYTRLVVATRVTYVYYNTFTTFHICARIH